MSIPELYQLCVKAEISITETELYKKPKEQLEDIEYTAKIELEKQGR